MELEQTTNYIKTPASSTQCHSLTRRDSIGLGKCDRSGSLLGRKNLNCAVRIAEEEEAIAATVLEPAGKDDSLSRQCRRELTRIVRPTRVRIRPARPHPTQLPSETTHYPQHHLFRLPKPS